MEKELHINQRLKLLRQITGTLMSQDSYGGEVICRFPHYFVRYKPLRKNKLIANFHTQITSNLMNCFRYKKVSNNCSTGKISTSPHSPVTCNTVTSVVHVMTECHVRVHHLYKPECS